MQADREHTGASVDIYSEIKRLCDAFLEKAGKNAKSFRFTSRLKKGLQIPDDAAVYLAHDDTLLKSGKNGFAITDRGIFCRDLMDEVTEVTGLEELGKMTGLHWDDDNDRNNILAGKRKLVYYTDGYEEIENDLMTLLYDIIRLVSGKKIEAPHHETVTQEEKEETVTGERILAPAAEGANTGYCSVGNVLGFTDEQLYEKLSAVKVSFGTPVMGDLNGTPSVLYKHVTDNYDVFCRVSRNQVIMGKIGADGISSVQTAAEDGLRMLLGYSDEEESTANRAVDELGGVVRMLENGVHVTESAASAMGAPVSLYMTEHVLLLGSEFDIVDQDDHPVYHIEGDLLGLNFSIQRNGAEVMKLKKKLAAVLPEYSIEKDHTEIAKIKTKFRLTNPELTGQVKGKELKINGNLFGNDFDILVGGAVIGHVDKEFGFGSDHYHIRSFDPDMQDVVTALAVICDTVADKEEESDS